MLKYYGKDPDPDGWPDYSDMPDEMPASANAPKNGKTAPSSQSAPKKNGQTSPSSHSPPNNGHVPYANIINGVGAELAGYSVNQLHALAPYGSMLNKMSSEQISMLLEKVSSATPDGRALFASRPPPRRTSLPAQKRFIVTPGGDKMYM